MSLNESGLADFAEHGECSEGVGEMEGRDKESHCDDNDLSCFSSVHIHLHSKSLTHICNSVISDEMRFTMSRNRFEF